MNAHPPIAWLLPLPVLILLLLSVQLLPPLPLYLEVAPSMAAGTMMAALMVLFACLLNDLFLIVRRSNYVPIINVHSVAAVFVIATLILAHGIVADWIQPIDFGRFAASMVPLTIVLGAGIALGRALSACCGVRAEFVIHTSFWVLCGVIVLHVVGAQPRGDVWAKSTFPFTETSHFALAFTPVWLYRCARADHKTGLWWVAGGFAIALFVQSLAMLVGCLLAAAVSRRLILVTAPAGVLVLVGLPFLQLEYFTSRLDFSGNVVNLSNLVYLQGWQQLIESLELSSGWGVGFQQLGVRGTQAMAADMIRALTLGVDLNLLDGSFVLAKVGSEFGVIGLLLIVIYVAFAAFCLQGLRAQNAGVVVTFARCVVVAYSVDVFVRGTGYFTESTMLLVAAIAVLVVNRKASQVSAKTDLGPVAIP
jgi:hypothetical protein